MKLLKIIDNIAVEYTLEQFLQDHPEANVFKKSKSLPSPHELKLYDVYIPVEDDKPQGNYIILGQGEPVKIGDEWHIPWNYREMTESELNKRNEREEFKNHLLTLDRIDDYKG